ncbi:hypothetical protein Esi_0145_0025 [Ectocarpus siliculosus]|uniref:Uncharacterized protein n=1 Tax=Ectocarpus siliculosus TaxID=2880 RepID=D8LF92_ECTSI|nr:hypothetical protein Esi_0145_0025 [Ectocarpus siliculosus]|eukprot:CBN78817.1 hypothetical protein Esi_0145_0025 [Ectocarpus siliculosus]
MAVVEGGVGRAAEGMARGVEGEARETLPAGREDGAVDTLPAGSEDGAGTKAWTSTARPRTMATMPRRSPSTRPVPAVRPAAAAAAAEAEAEAQGLALRVEGEGGETLPTISEDGAARNAMATTTARPAMMATVSVRHAVAAVAAVAVPAAAQGWARRVEGEAGETLPVIGLDGTGATPLGTMAHNPVMAKMTSLRRAVVAAAAQGRARRVEGEAGETLPAIGQDGTGATPLGTMAHTPVMAKMTSLRRATVMVTAVTLAGAKVAGVAAAGVAAAAAVVVTAVTLAGAKVSAATAAGVVVVAEAMSPRCEVAGSGAGPTLHGRGMAHGDRGHFHSAQGGSQGRGGGTANRGGPDMGVDAAGPMGWVGPMGNPGRGFGAAGAAASSNTTEAPGGWPHGLEEVADLDDVSPAGNPRKPRNLAEERLQLGREKFQSDIMQKIRGWEARAAARLQVVVRDREGREFTCGERRRLTSMAARREADALRAAILTRARAKVALSLQRAFRARRRSRAKAATAVAREQAAREARAAVRLQAVMRGRAGREFVRGERRRLASMAVLVQAAYRGRAARGHVAEWRAAREARERAAAAAAAVSAALEGVVAGVVEARDAAAREQAAREARAAVRLQAVMRGRAGRGFARGERRRLASMAVLVQAAYRGRAARRHVAALRAEAAAAAAAALEGAVEEQMARIEAEEARAAAAAATALARRKGWWWWQVVMLLMTVVVAVGTWPVLLLQGPLSVPCGRTSLASGEGPMAVGECVESEGGSRYLGWVPGVSWKARLTVTDDGAVYSGTDGKEVPFSAVLGKDLSGNGGDGGDDGNGQDGAGGMLCSAERLVRRAVPFIGDFEHRARMRGEKLVVGRGFFCRTHETPRRPPRSVIDALFRGRGGGVASFSEHTGDLHVVNSRGKVVWEGNDRDQLL